MAVATPAQQRIKPLAGPRPRRFHLSKSTRGWSRAIIWSLIGLTGFGVAFASVARIDTSISAAGKLEPRGGTLEVLPPFTAPIRRVWVRDGETVSRGQPLLELDRDTLDHQRQDLENLAPSGAPKPIKPRSNSGCLP